MTHLARIVAIDHALSRADQRDRQFERDCRTVHRLGPHVVIMALRRIGAEYSAMTGIERITAEFAAIGQNAAGPDDGP